MKKLLSIVQHQTREPFGRVSFIRASTSVPTLILSFTNPNPQNDLSIRRLRADVFYSNWASLCSQIFQSFLKFVCISSLSSFLLTLSSARVYQWQMALDLGICCQLLYCCGGWIHKWSNVLISSSDQQLNEYYARLSMQTPFFMSPSQCFVCSKFGAIKFREVHASLNNISSSPFSFYSSQFQWIIEIENNKKHERLD